jgi:hypothetical protein
MTKVCVVSPNGYVRVPTPRLWVAQDLTLSSKVGGIPSPAIAVGGGAIAVGRLGSLGDKFSSKSSFMRTMGQP